jgi:translation elongation factor EF-Tu-like GTPase
MEIEDAFAAKEDGVLVSGKRKAGQIMVGDEVEIIGFNKVPQKANIFGFPRNTVLVS